MRARGAWVHRTLWAFVALLCALAAPRATWAHEMRPAVLQLHADAEGRVEVRWTPPRSRGRVITSVVPIFPAHCRRLSPTSLDCGARGLAGELRFDGLSAGFRPSRDDTEPADPTDPEAHPDARDVDIVVQIEHADGRKHVATLNHRRPALDLGLGSGLPLATLFAAYLELGVEHILLGFDHGLFVLGLMLVVGIRRQLIWTITAFTVAHSVTLAFGVLGWVEAPSAWVELMIALSILLVAVEATHERPTLTRRAPWLIAFAFGLLHGFGFVGALSEIGLPADQLGWSLAAFNLGVELGQLALVFACMLVVRLMARRPQTLERLRRPTVYLIGSLAAFWSIERGLALFGVHLT